MTRDRVRIPKLGSTGQLLRGWIDLDEMFGGGDAPAVTPEGARNQVFAGRPAPVPA